MYSRRTEPAIKARSPGSPLSSPYRKIQVTFKNTDLVTCLRKIFQRFPMALRTKFRLPSMACRALRGLPTHWALSHQPSLRFSNHQILSHPRAFALPAPPARTTVPKICTQGPLLSFRSQLQREPSLTTPSKAVRSTLSYISRYYFLHSKGNYLLFYYFCYFGYFCYLLAICVPSPQPSTEEYVPGKQELGPSYIPQCPAQHLAYCRHSVKMCWGCVQRNTGHNSQDMQTAGVPTNDEWIKKMSHTHTHTHNMEYYSP